MVDAFKEKTRLQLRCFRMVASCPSEADESEELSQLEEIPKHEEPLIKKPMEIFNKPPKEEFKAKREEPKVEEFKKVRKYKPMPEGFD